MRALGRVVHCPHEKRFGSGPWKEAGRPGKQLGKSSVLTYVRWHVGAIGNLTRLPLSQALLPARSE
jgi:hypothetical protein